MANYSGISASLIALFKPSTLQPRLSIPSIASLNWHKLKHEGGITGIVVDKDNCIAKPSEDSLAPDPALRESWQDLLRVFGPENVLVVSNSAGTLSKDPLLLQAESVSRNLGVPVLVHRTPKPGPTCVKQVAAHFLLPRPSSSSSSNSSDLSPLSRNSPVRGQIVFSPLAASRARLLPSPTPSPASSSPRSPRLLVIGDRLATDMILSHRLSRLSLPLSLPSSSTSSSSPTSPSKSRLKRLLSLFRRTRHLTLGRPGERIETVAILTTTLHAREGLGTSLLRAVERAAVWGLQRAKRRRVVRGLGVKGRVGTEKEGAEGSRRGVEEVEWEKFLTTYKEPVVPSVEAVTPSAPLPGESSLFAVLPPTHAQSAPTSPPAPSPPMIDRLRSLPHTLQSLPLRLKGYLLSLPPRLSLSLRLSLRRLSLHLQRSLPLLLASLHAPLSRLVRIYTEPASLAGTPSGANPERGASPERARVTDLTVAWTERAVKSVEKRLEGLKGLRALAEARVEEVEKLRRGLGGLGGLGRREEKQGGKDVEGKGA